MKKCAVIGAGLGGLSAAIEIAKLGIQVDVFEKNKTTGGKANNLKAKGFRFDTGPSLLTMPFVLESLFKNVDIKLKNTFSIKPLQQHCKYFFPDETVITAYNDKDAFLSEIEEKTIDTSKSVKKYLSYCKTIYDLTADLFLFNDIHEFTTLRQKGSFKTLFQLHKLDAMRSVHKANSSFFKDSNVLQIFDRYATYNGSNPYLAPATLNIIPHVEYNMGSFYIEQGIYRISESLTELAKHLGVNFHLDKEVTDIYHNKKIITGIGVDGERLPYDLVVSNSDVNFTYKNLLKDTKSSGAKKYAKLEPSSSAIVFHWGIKNIHSKLVAHNILFSKNYKHEFDELFAMKGCPDDPTVYIYVSNKFNKSDAPMGSENWFVMINAPYNNNHNWDEIIPHVRRTVIKKIESILGISINEKIVFEHFISPATIERDTRSYRGSIYGISSNNRSAAFLRQRVRSTTYKNLYFVGGSAHPGGGIPLVLLSGKICAQLVNKFF